MNTINDITKENFNNMFNIKEILNDSVFYPSSGIDGAAIEYFSNKYRSFIHVDYSTQREVVEEAMKTHFAGVGYDLIGLKYVLKEEITPNGYRPPIFVRNEGEIEKWRLSKDFWRNLYLLQDITPFALWAVYELNPKKTGNIIGKAKRFSLLHIGGESCATFEALYIENKINPKCIAIIHPGTGFGDNWTDYTDPNCRLYQNLVFNQNHNNADMPETLVTSFVPRPDGSRSCFWPHYKFQNSFSYFCYYFNQTCDLAIYHHRFKGRKIQNFNEKTSFGNNFNECD